MSRCKYICLLKKKSFIAFMSLPAWCPHFNQLVFALTCILLLYVSACFVHSFALKRAID